MADDELLPGLERQIVQRTMGRVRRLKLEVRGNCVVIQGFTSSYFVKQLAIEAALEVLRPALGEQLELDVQLSVIGSDSIAGLDQGLAAQVV